MCRETRCVCGPGEDPTGPNEVSRSGGAGDIAEVGRTQGERPTMWG